MMRPENVYVLSPLQEGILFHTLYAPGEGLYTDQLLTKIRGAVSVPVFEKAWERVFDRHPILRTSFAWEKLEKPVQVVRTKARPTLEVHDWKALSADARERRLQELLDTDRRRGFDLTTAPLARLTLVWLENELFYLLWTYHHILMDAWSGAIVFGEVFASYESELRGAVLEFPPALPYQQHISWLRRQDKAAAEAFWRRELAGFSAPLALAIEPPPAAYTGRSCTFETVLSEAKTTEILATVRRNRLTSNTLVQGVWALLLSRYGGTEDVLFGFVVAGRSADLPAIETAVGLYINTLPARVRVAGDESLLAFFRRLQAHQVEVRRHEHVQLAELQGWSQVPRGKPLFETLLAFQNLPEASADLQLSLELLESRYLTRTNYPLTLVVTPGARLRFEITYDAGRFDPAEMERLGERLASLLTAASSRIDEPVWQIPILLPEEQRQVLQGWSGASRRLVGAVDAPCLHQLFAEQVRRAPEAVAVSCAGAELTYTELARSARRLAHRLRVLGVRPDVIVGLCAERSLELVIGVLGILEAGGAYLPLDPAYPPDRLAFLLEDSGAHALVATGPLPQELERRALPRVHLGDALNGEAGEDPGPFSGPQSCGDNIAYVIYTSGSTGRPKGVLVPHANAVRLLERTRDLFAFDERDVWTLFHSYAFDFSVWELWGALLHGGRLVVLPQTTSRSPEALRGLLVGEGVTVLNQTPSACYALIEAATGAESPAPALRWIIFGGEALEPRRLRDGFRRLGSLSTRWANMYGITETTVHVTWREVTEADAERRGSPVGGPIPGWECYLLDSHLQPVAPGLPGEIHVGGEGLARGYLGRPDLTAERFVPHPFGRPGERLYRSGDIARHLPDGGLDYLGRADHQVKIRGFRIEPAETAAALCRCPGVRDAVVVVREDRPGERRLVAYYLSAVEPPPSAAALRETLRRSLPDYMVPAAYVALETFPLTGNGKLDRWALPTPEESEPAVGRALPQGPIEETLVGIWEEVLGRERVGAEDDFFALGGHSLLATRLVSRLRRSFSVDVPLAALFERPTPRSLAARIEAALRVGSAAEAPLERSPREGSLPLSFAQERLWFLDQLEPGSAAYNVPAALRLVGPLDPAVLAWSLGEVVRRHEVLRTTFPAQEGLPFQVIADRLEIPLPRVDLRALPVPVREAEVRRLAAEDAIRPFDLARGPLLRAHLLSLRKGEHGLLLSIHHIVSDAWSLEVLLGELLALSQARRTGHPSPLPELPLQYTDYAVWQRGLLTAGLLEPQFDYWRRRLSNPPEPLNLPADRARQPVRSSRGGARVLEIGAAGTVQALRDLSRKQGATLFMTLLASFDALLARLTGALDLQVGVPSAGRDQLELEELIGLFVNTLVIRTDMTGRPRFNDLLARVRGEVLEAHAHKDLPFERLVEELQPERRLGETPLFQVLFALQNAPWERVESTSLSLSPIVAAGGTAKLDLSLIIVEREAGLTASLQYASDLFDSATAERLLGHYASLLRGALADPGRPVAELPLLSAAERSQLLIEWNATGGALRDACIHHLIEAQADRRGEAVALERDGERMTYAELEARANRVARHLRDLGVGPEIRVGIFLRRTPSLAVAILGVLKAGGAYVGLEPGYPQERLTYLLKDSAARVLVTERELLGVLTTPPSRIVCLEDLEAGDGDSERLPCAAGPGSMAYLIYTSGSTGNPKGSIIEHHSAVSLIRWSQQIFGDEVFSTMLFSSAFSFDLSVFELLVPLALGGRVVLCDSILGLTGLSPETGVETLLTVPSAMTELLRLGALPPSVKTVCLAGEALPRRLADDLFATGSVAAVWNLYGPSEYTTFASFAAVPRKGRGAPPVGRPLAATRLYVLDREMEPLPVGVAGELYITGDGLARGYLDRADLTAERFLPDPFGPPGGRLYRTGDLVRWRHDGEAEYLGRLDHQVKVRGFRIELGELETLLEQHPEICEAIVLARDDQPGDRRLVAYVVGRDSFSVSAAELRSHLRERLPEHMVPAAVVALDAMPVTPNGKVDRKALAKIAPDWESAAGAAAVSTPTEEIVAGVWAEVLGIERVGALDNFFDLGGHSLLATRVVSRLRALFGVDLPLRALFKSPTVRALARDLQEARVGGDAAGATPLRRADAGERTQLSFAQERLWFLSQLRAGGAEYNIPLAVRLTGSLDLAAFASCVAEVVRRHESLRTAFAEAGDEPVQVIAGLLELPLAVLDLSALPTGSRGQAERSLTAEEVARPFDLRRGPLFRLLLLRTGPAEHLAVLIMHHIISDGWSMGVFFREVAALYRAFLEGSPSPLSELPIQYGDFAAWQRRRLSGELLDRLLGYWTRQLRGELEPLALPTDRPRPPVPRFRGRRQVLALPQALAEKITALSRGEGVTLFMTLLAAFQTLLYRTTGQTDLRIGSAIAGRTLPETEDLIGFFVNMLVLRADLSGNPTFRELLERIRNVALEAYAHQELPLEQLADELQPVREAGRTPFFQIAFGVQNAPLDAQELPGLSLEVVDLEAEAARFDLTVWAFERPEGIALSWTWDADLFEAETIQRLHARLETLLRGMVENPDGELDGFTLLGEEERERKVAQHEASHKRFLGLKARAVGART